MRFPLRSRNIGLLIFVGVCTIVFFTLRRSVQSDSSKRDEASGGIVFEDSEFDIAPDDKSEVLHPDGSHQFSEHCYQVSPLDCVFDNKVSPGCYLINNVEAVVPLGLIKNQYEVFGGVHRGSNTLYVHHVNVEIPSTTPDPHEATGRYMFFHKYNVESRPRVKLVVADEGIPISTQWDPKGYPYAIQIAQFGLSHYTKLLMLKQTFSTNSDGRKEAHMFDLDLKNSGKQAIPVRLEGQENWIQLADGSIRFRSASSSLDAPKSGPTLHLLTNSTWRYLVLSGREWHEGSLMLVHVHWIQSAVTDPLNETEPHAPTTSFYLAYACSSAPSGAGENPFLSVSGQRRTATFWMPHCAGHSRENWKTDWQLRLARDLFSDVFKAFGTKTDLGLNHLRPRRSRRDQIGWPEEMDLSKHRIRVQSIQFLAGSSDHGDGGLIDELRLGLSHQDLPSSERTPSNLRTEQLFHEYRFLAASNWFLHNQGPDGTWSIPVARNFRGRVPINPGWPSAMGQGHGLSLLVRAHFYTGNMDYFLAALNALQVFNLSVTQHGVRSLFLNQTSLPWYEEYPTEPGNFVLNGFIYALFGLYDLVQVELKTATLPKSNAGELLESGLQTLSSILPLFDSGTGSFYDLRHVMQYTKTQAVVSPSPRLSRDGSTPSLAAGPNRARWDYHAVHIRQLRILAVVDKPERAEQWMTTANRWTSYMVGLRSPHN